MAQSRKRICATRFRRAPDGSAFRKCKSCGLSVAIALANMHECRGRSVVKKAKIRGESQSRKEEAKNGDELRFQDQPRSGFRLFMEEFSKRNGDEDWIGVDRRGFRIWGQMLKLERLPYELRAREIDLAHSISLNKEKKNMHSVDDEADSAEVGKYDKAYEDCLGSDTYGSGGFLFFSDES